MIIQVTPSAPQTRKWTREEYYRLAEEGIFDGQRVQRINGEIITMPAMGHPHVRCVSLLRVAAESTFGPGHWVREEKPLACGQASDPEPDIAVAERPMREYRDHPTTALFVVEVADSTIALDRRKASLYASVGVPDYWIVNLNKRQIEVHRTPVQDATEEFGWRYADRQVLSEGDTASPTARPQVKWRVVDLLP